MLLIFHTIFKGGFILEIEPTLLHVTLLQSQVYLTIVYLETHAQHFVDFCLTADEMLQVRKFKQYLVGTTYKYKNPEVCLCISSFEKLKTITIQS